MLIPSIREFYWEQGAWVMMSQSRSAEVSRMSKCLSTKWLEFGDWNPDMFKDRDVDLEVICVEVSANIEIMVWE